MCCDEVSGQPVLQIRVEQPGCKVYEMFEADSVALPVASEAVTVTESGVLLTVAVIVPEMTPVVMLMLSPPGKPLAL